MDESERSLLLADYNQNAKAIQNWKKHQLRAVHQEKAREFVLDELDETSVFIVVDWAMKWLSTKYRESQSSWFEKKSLPWHLSHVV